MKPSGLHLMLASYFSRCARTECVRRVCFPVYISSLRNQFAPGQTGKGLLIQVVSGWDTSPCDTHIFGVMITEPAPPCDPSKPAATINIHRSPMTASLCKMTQIIKKIMEKNNIWCAVTAICFSTNQIKKILGSSVSYYLTELEWLLLGTFKSMILLQEC